ncbi:hypothetical protein, partial [Methanobrevibacter sp.]
MKKYSLIFSILLVFILVGAGCVSAAEMDDSTPVILENSDMELSQGDNIDLNYEYEILENDNDDEVSQGESLIGDGLLEESTVEVGSDDVLVLEDSVDDVDSDLEVISDGSVDDVDSDLEVIFDESESKDVLGSVDVDSELSDGVSELPDLVINGYYLDHLNQFLYYMQLTDMNVKKQYRDYLSAIFQTDVPLEHSNVLRLSRDINTISDKLIIKIDSGKDIVIDGDGHTINMAG